MLGGILCKPSTIVVRCSRSLHFTPEGNEASQVGGWVASQVGGWVACFWDGFKSFKHPTTLAKFHSWNKLSVLKPLFISSEKKWNRAEVQTWNPRDVPGIRKAWRKVLPWSQPGGSHQMDWAKGEKGLMKIEETCNHVYSIYRIFLYIIKPDTWRRSCIMYVYAKVEAINMWSKNSLRCHPALRRHVQMALVDQQGTLGSTGSKSSYLNRQDPHWARCIHIILSSSVWRRALKRLERLSKWSWVFLGDQHAGNVAFN